MGPMMLGEGGKFPHCLLDKEGKCDSNMECKTPCETRGYHKYYCGTVVPFYCCCYGPKDKSKQITSPECRPDKVNWGQKVKKL
nr:hypothetical protein Itr_chr07CG18800 [Ipomoea trifida]